MSIVAFFVFLVIFLAVLWGAKKLIAAFAIEDPIATIIWVFIVLAAIVFFLSNLPAINAGSLRI